MKPGMIACLLALALVVIVGCSKPAAESTGTVSPSPAATATPDPLAFARANYAKQCVECHGGQGEGGLVKVDDKKLKVPSFTEGHALKHTDEDFVDQIKDGGDGMPKFSDKLSEQEINDLVRFIRREFQKKQ